VAQLLELGLKAKGRQRSMNIGKLSGDERITRAKERADKLVGHIATLFLMHEANALVVYSPKLGACLNSLLFKPRRI
jgi:phage terminase large subunit-like protein